MMILSMLVHSSVIGSGVILVLFSENHPYVADRQV